MSEWIPIKDRLPEDGQQVLVTAEIHYIPDHIDDLGVYIGVTIATYCGKCGIKYRFFGAENIGRVYAWMPLPKTYEVNE